MRALWSLGLYSFSVSLCLGIFGTLTTFFYPDLSFKVLFVFPRLHWCVDYCHSLLLKGRVCNRWTLWNWLTVAVSAGWSSWQCCWLWNEEDTYRFIKRPLFHQLGEVGITQRKSELPASLLPSELLFCFLLELVFFMVYTSQRRSDSPLPPFRH